MEYFIHSFLTLWNLVSLRFSLMKIGVKKQKRLNFSLVVYLPSSAIDEKPSPQKLFDACLEFSVYVFIIAEATGHWSVLKSVLSLLHEALLIEALHP